MQKRFFLSLALLCLVQFGSFGQRLAFHHLSTNEGLSEGVNHFVRRDGHGYMWLSSIEGLNRFDGARVRVYSPASNQTTPKTLAGNNVLSAVYEDARQNLWFATQEGINRYNRTTDDFDHTRIAGETAEQYRPFFLDPDGFFWVDLGSKGVWRLNTNADMQKPVAAWQFPAGQVLAQKYFPVKDPQTGYLKKLYTIDRDSAGVFEYEVIDNQLQLKRRLLTTIPNTSETLDAVCLLVSSDEILWVGSKKGLIRFDLTNAEDTIFTEIKNVPLTNVRALVEINPNEIGIATRDQGLLLLNLSNNSLLQYTHSESDPYSISSNRIENLYFDTEQRTLWVSIWGQGVDYATFGKSKFELVRLPNKSGKPDDAVFVPLWFAPYENRGVWCASPLSGGLRLLDLNGKLIKDYSNQTEQVNDLHTTAQGTTFFCSADKGLLFKKRGAEILMPITENGKTIWSFGLFESKNGQVYAFGDGQVYQLVAQSNTFIARPISNSPLDTMMLNKLYEDANGRGYGDSGKDGLLIFEGHVADGRILKSDSRAKGINFFTENGVYVWAAGSFGLLRIDKQTLETKLFDERQGLPTKVLYSVLPVGDEALWLGTNQGLVRFDLRNNLFDVFDMADGLQGKEFNPSSCLIAPDGRYWFGGVKGINIFEADHIRLVSQPPKIQIADILINDLPYTTSNWHLKAKLNPCELGELSLDHDENTLTFYFAALEYSDPQSNKVFYKLEPLDTAWVEMPQTGFVRFSRLPPNHYRLKVQGQSSDGIRSETLRELSITIIPPFYKTTWFLTLLGLLVLGILSVVIGENFRRERLKSEVAQLSLQALSVQLINHLFGNTMTTLNSLIGRSPDSATLYLANLSGFLREVLTNSRKMIVRLDEEIEMIKSYLKLEEQQFEPGKLEYLLPEEEDIDPEGFKVPSMILQPFVENAIVHGLRARGYGKIVVSTSREGNHVLCVVQDNGIGRGEINGAKKRISHGIDIVRQHLQLYDRKNGTRSNFNIIDLNDDAQQPTGTRVEIRLGIPPKNKNALNPFFRLLTKRYP